MAKIIHVSAGSLEAIYFDRVASHLALDGHDLVQVHGRPALHPTHARLIDFPARERRATPARALEAIAHMPALSSEVTRIVFTDVVLRGDVTLAGATTRLSFDEAIAAVLTRVSAWIELFEEERPQLVIASDGSESIRHTAELACRHLGIRFRCELVSPFRDRVLLTPGFDGRLITRDDLDRVDDDALIEAKELLSSYRVAKGRQTLSVLPDPGTDPRVYARALRDTTGGRRAAAILGVARRRVEPRFARAVRRRLAAPLYQRPAREHAVLFPLHYRGDAPLVIRGWPFEDQEDLCRNIARSLPHDARLWVKEHPAAPGQMAVSSLRRLRKLGNVRVVHPSSTAWDLFDECDAVVVVNSTTGFEALVAGKPVLALGRTYYTELGVTTDVTSLFDLPAALGHVLSAGPPDEQQIVRFVAALRAASAPFAHHRFDDSEENVVATASGLVVAAASS